MKGMEMIDPKVRDPEVFERATNRIGVSYNRVWTGFFQ